MGSSVLAALLFSYWTAVISLWWQAI